MPESFAPPKGVLKSRRNQQLTQEMPTSIAWPTRGARAENFVLHRARGCGEPGPQGRLDPGAVVARVAEFRHAAAGDDLGAFLFRELVVGEDFLAVLLR